MAIFGRRAMYPPPPVFVVAHGGDPCFGFGPSYVMPSIYSENPKFGWWLNFLEEYLLAHPSACFRPIPKQPADEYGLEYKIYDMYPDQMC